MSPSTTIEMSPKIDAKLPRFKGGQNGKGGHVRDESDRIEAVRSNQEGNLQRIEAKEGREVVGDKRKASEAVGEASEERR